MQTLQKAVPVNTSADDEEPHWISRGAFQIVVLVLVGVEVLLAIALRHDWIWLIVPLVMMAGHLMHGILIGFHEAAHGNLRKSRWFNDFDGTLIGIFSFFSFTLYRVAHQTHHAYLLTEKDLEFWPFVQTEKPRWSRCLAAVLELNFGMFYTPLLFFRAFINPHSPIKNRRIRRRVWIEMCTSVFAWILIITATSVLDLWKYLVWMYLVPAFVAGNLQSWRKYIEHVGMTGTTANGATRSIVADNWIGRLVSFTLLHEPLHGIHHQRAGLPHAELPRHLDKLQPRFRGERPPFRSYGHAFRDLLHCLKDPQVGPQWRTLH